MKRKHTLLLIITLLMTSMAVADDIEPPPLPGEDGDLDTDPDEPQTPSGEAEADPEDLEDLEDREQFDPDRIDQDRGIEETETDEYTSGGVEETGISGVISSITSAIGSLIPF